MGGKGVTDTIDFEWVTDFQPQDADIEREQDERGYNKWGYGEPFDVTMVLIEPGKWKTTWRCWGSCD